MSAGTRIVLAVLLALAAGLVALWLSVTVGVWLAVHAVTGTALTAVPFLAAVLVIVAFAVALLAADLRHPERRQ